MKKVCLFIMFILVLLTGCAKKEIPSDPVGAPALTSEEMMLSEERARVEAQREQQLREQQLREQQLQQRKLEQDAAAREQQRALEEKQQQLVQEIESQRIFFDFDSFELNEKGRNILQHVARVMREYQNLGLRVEGHCDERGTSEYNMALGERRARAVFDFLVVLGVGSNRLEVLSFGEERPLDFGHTESAWAMNRRAEFYFLK